MKNYLMICQPDTTATIDVLDSYPEEGLRVQGCQVRISLEWDTKSKISRIRCYVQDVATDEILLDEERELTTEEHKPKRRNRK